MTNFQEGDLVRATKGDTVVQGRIIKGEGNVHFWVGEKYVGQASSTLINNGYVFELLEAAKRDPKEVVREVITYIENAEWSWGSLKEHPLTNAIRKEFDID